MNAQTSSVSKSIDKGTFTARQPGDISHVMMAVDLSLEISILLFEERQSSFTVQWDRRCLPVSTTECLSLVWSGAETRPATRQLVRQIQLDVSALWPA